MNFGKPLTMCAKLRAMALVGYISAFGSIVDQNSENATYKQRAPFKLWPRQAEAAAFAEEHQITLWPKSRQKGLSELAAERALKTIMQNENVEGAAISKSEKYAKYFLERRILSKYKEMDRKWPGKFPKLLKETKEELVWEGGRSMKSLSSSDTGAASLTADFMIFDEAGGIEENHGDFEAILTNSIPACDQNPDSWIMIIGTSVPGTYYNKLVQEAVDQKNQGEFKYFFIGWRDQPGRDDVWYAKQEGRLKEAVRLQHPEVIEDFFYIKDGLVFPHFDHVEGGAHLVDFDIGKKFYRNEDGKIKMLRASYNDFFFTVYDHGTRHPAANLYFLYEKYSDILYVFDEDFFKEGHGLEVGEIAKEIKMTKKFQPRHPDKQIADGAIFNEVGIDSVGQHFRDAGLPFRKAKKHDEKASRELVAKRFRQNKIIIHARKCPGLVTQLKGYRWNPKASGEKPIEKDDDAIDCLRYACNECKQEEKPEEEKKLDAYEKSRRKRISDQKSKVTVTGGAAASNSWQGY